MNMKQHFLKKQEAREKMVKRWNSEKLLRESYLSFYEKSQAVLEKSLKNTCERVHL